MRLVYIPGVWDLLHVGHVTVLQRAKALGDRLIVGVPSDQAVIQDKGMSPIISLSDRMSMLESLSCTDVVVPYYGLDFLPHLNMFKPSILVVGETWGSLKRHQQAEDWVKRNDCQMLKMPYFKNESTTSIRQRILKRN